MDSPSEYPSAGKILVSNFKLKGMIIFQTPCHTLWVEFSGGIGEVVIGKVRGKSGRAADG